MTRFSTEPEQRHMLKDMGFSHLQEVCPTNMGEMIESCYKNRTRCCEN